MSALKIAANDLFLITLLIIAKPVSKIGTAKTIKGAIKTSAVYVLATPRMAIMASEYPKKLDPVSPRNVLAGLKLKGMKPRSAPARAVISIILIKGEPFNEKIINKETHDIIEIPVDNPSKPSIRLIAFTIAIIHIIVIVIDRISLLIIPPKPYNLIYSNSAICNNSCS